MFYAQWIDWHNHRLNTHQLNFNFHDPISSRDLPFYHLKDQRPKVKVISNQLYLIHGVYSRVNKPLDLSLLLVSLFLKLNNLNWATVCLFSWRGKDANFRVVSICELPCWRNLGTLMIQILHWRNQICYLIRPFLSTNLVCLKISFDDL